MIFDIYFFISITSLLIWIYFVYSIYVQNKYALKINENAKNYLENKKISKLKYICFWLWFLVLLIWNLNIDINFFNTNQTSVWYKIVFILDSSKSMDVLDMESVWYKLSRLDFSKKMIQKFINNIDWEFSLITFAWEALIISPLITEKNMFLTFLENINSSTIKKWWTNLEEAINIATTNIWEDEEKIMIIISDWWEEEDELNLNNIKNILKDKKIKIFTVWVWSYKWDFIVIGQDFFWNNIYQKWKWNNVISKLYEKNLKEIGELWKWKYIKASDLDTLENLKKYLNTNSKNNFKNKSDAIRFFVILSLIFFIIWTILQNKKIIN